MSLSLSLDDFFFLNTAKIYWCLCLNYRMSCRFNNNLAAQKIHGVMILRLLVVDLCQVYYQRLVTLGVWIGYFVDSMPAKCGEIHFSLTVWMQGVDSKCSGCWSWCAFTICWLDRQRDLYSFWWCCWCCSSTGDCLSSWHCPMRSKYQLVIWTCFLTATISLLAMFVFSLFKIKAKYWASFVKLKTIGSFCPNPLNNLFDCK